MLIPSGWILPLVQELFFDLGEEITSDTMDVKGDKVRSSQCRAKRRGKDLVIMFSGSLRESGFNFSFIRRFYRLVQRHKDILRRKKAKWNQPDA